MGLSQPVAPEWPLGKVHGNASLTGDAELEAPVHCAASPCRSCAAEKHGRSAT